MRKLLRFLNHYKMESILAPLFKLLEASFELFVPLVMAAIIDVGIAGKDYAYIWKMGALLVLLAVVGLAASLTAQYFAARAAVGFSARLKHELLEHIQKLSFGDMDLMGTSTMITRMTSDVNQVQAGVNLVLRLFMRSPFIVFGAMIMAFTVDVQAALVFVVAIPLLSLVVFGVMALSIPRYKKVQDALDKLLGRTRENLTGARVLRAFHKQGEEREHFTGENQELNRLQQSVGRIAALMNPITYLILNGAIIALIWTGAVRVDMGVLSQGQVVALINYMSQILVELVKLANLIVSVNKAVACGNRIQEIFELEPGLTGPETEETWPEEVEAKRLKEMAPETGDAVVFEHVGLVYPGASEESLTDIHFSVKKGEVIGVIGGTGSGKTSLVHLLPRFYDITAGRLLIDGVEAGQYNLRGLREKVGIVLQKSVLFQGTIRSNLLWGRKDATEEELWQALRIAQAEEIVRQKKDGLDEKVEQEGRNFSGGQKQRLAIARALVRRPDILILDDSASALDYATDAALRKAIGEELTDMTLFIVSQRTASVRNADKIVVLEDGRMAGLGTHEQLRETCEVYREICKASERGGSKV
ncbi:MAG: ABC transporter ATP-binding protein [Lachnospiraceae bacterium]|nr:ABC transporter ATP-binding protein [Lachnospiraceae bacterium]